MKFHIVLIFFLFNLNLSSQNLGLENKDSVLFGHYLPDLEITASSADFVKKWNRTKFYVKSVYDYAKICSAMFISFEDSLAQITGKYSKKKYLSNCNKILKKEFGNEIKEMSVKRGVYLMKMIYRQTGLTTYEIVQKYRGGGTAFWFQALCLVNGQDLKREYDPENEDLLMERAIRLIDSGKMTYYKRVPLTDEARKALKKNRKEKRRNKSK
mgnify:FL=1|tara:strand:- start:508 stop:1143 length:636 start_codon:yes stop_codon:yes gene_type:complete